MDILFNHILYNCNLWKKLCHDEVDKKHIQVRIENFIKLWEITLDTYASNYSTFHPNFTIINIINKTPWLHDISRSNAKSLFYLTTHKLSLIAHMIRLFFKCLTFFKLSWICFYYERRRTTRNDKSCGTMTHYHRHVFCYMHVCMYMYIKNKIKTSFGSLGPFV